MRKRGCLYLLAAVLAGGVGCSVEEAVADGFFTGISGAVSTVVSNLLLSLY